MPVNKIPERFTCISVSRHTGTSREEERSTRAVGLLFNTSGQRLQEALGARAFALQGIERDHIMTAEGEPCRRRRSTSRLRTRA